MKSPHSSLASRYSVAFILCLSCLMILIASALSVSPNSSLASSTPSSSPSDARVSTTAAPNPREPFASTLASQPSPLNPIVNTTVTATKTHTPSGNRAPGDTLMYTVVITNTGAADATGVSFTDTIDPNTTLMGVVASSPIAFDDAYTASGNIPIAPATSLLANDIDPDSGTNAGLTVSQVQGAAGNVGNPTNTTAVGIGSVHGTVTVAANGTFTYQPPPGFTGADTFTYQISDASGKTGSGNVTITVSNMVWFIDNSSVVANSRGTFTEPFKTIAAFNAINSGIAPNAQPGHHVVLRPAGGGYAEADGINLRDNQTLTGPAVAFSSVFVADANSTSAYTTFAGSTGTAVAITTTAGNGVDLASGNALRGFNIGNTPSNFGVDGTVVGSLTVATVSKTGTGGAMRVSTSGTFGATVNFGTFESTNSATNNLNLVGVTGTLGITSAGTGFAGSAANNAAINISSGSVSFTYAGNVSKTTTGTLLNGGLLSVSNGHTGTLIFNTGTLNASSGTGLQFDNADGTYNFNGTNTLVGGDAGVDILNNSSGVFTFSSSTNITSPTGTAFNVNSSSPGVTYSGNITQNTAAQRVVNIDTTTSNLITFQTGTITGGPNSTGININAANGNVTFSNGMTLGTIGSRMVNQALTITGGTGTYNLGVVSIFTSSAAGFVATSADGTINNSATSVVDSSSASAININGPVVGLTSLGLTFVSVSSSGGTGNGIIISNTNGSFTINGTGSPASGGTIANKTGADGSATQGTGVYLNNAMDISLSWMQLNGFQNNGIRGATVTDFTLDNTIINGTNGTTAAGGSEEGAVRFDGLVGSCAITNSTLGGVGAGNSSFSDDLRVTNSSGNLNRLTCTNVHFGDISTGGNNALTFVALTSAVMNLTLQDSFFTNAIGSLATITPSNNATMDLIIRRNKFSNNNVNQSSGGGGLAVQGGTGAPACTYDISCNTFRDSIGIALLVAKGNGSGAWTGDIIHNTIGVTGVSLSGSTQASGIKVKATGTNTHTVMIRDNVVRQYNENGIFIQNNDGSATLNASVFNNITAEGGPFTLSGLDVDVGAIASDTSIINVVVGSAGTAGDKNDLSNGDPANGCDVNLSRIAGAGTQLNLSKNGSASGTAAAVIDDDNLNPATTNTCVAGTVNLVATLPATPPAVAACTLPPIPPPETGQSIQSAVAENSATESEDMPSGTLVVARGENPVDNNVAKLTQADLNWMVQAAIARWVETGISTEDFTRLQAVTFEVDDLPSSELASINGTQVKIDVTAAGYGWFFDQSPAEDGEFQVPVPGKELQTRYLSPARDKMDLLTVVMRQLGEVYFQGKDRVPKNVRQNLKPMMEPTLSPGVRRLPLNQFRITPSTTGSIKPVDGGLVQAPTTATQASAAPTSTEPARNQTEPDAANVLASTDRFGGRARYAVYNSATNQRSPINAVMRFNNARDASAYAAIRARRVGSAAPFAGETVTVNGSGGGFTLPVGKSVTIMFSAMINSPLPANVCSVTNPASGSPANVTGTNFNPVTIAPDTATIVKAPTIGMCPANITKNTDPNVCTAVTTFTPPTSDACPAATVTCVPGSGTAFAKGTTTVTCTAANGTLPNATCTFTVTVNDAQAPVLSGCTDQTINTAAGVCTATATYTPTATDNCDGSRPVTCVPASGSTFNKGVTTVSCSASDLNSPTPNTGMCTFTITVNDNQAPVLSGCTNQSLNTAAGVCTATATYAPTATDNCDGSRPVTCVPASGATFNKGVTTVSCSASDLNAPPNTGMCTFTITVTDNQAPVLSGCTNITTNTAAGVCTAAPTYTPTATDNCDGSRPVTCVPASGSTFNKGVTTVNCSASDLSSNTGMCSFTVTVNDNQAPVLTGCTNQTINAGAGMCTATATYTPTATDNCDGSRPVTCVPASGSTFQKGVTTVTCSASDLNAPPNTGMCMFTITVNDTQPPVVTCPASGGAFAASDCLPSQSSAYTGATLYSVGPNTVTNAVLSNFTPCTPPPVSGMATINFTGIVTGDLAMGGPPTHFQAPVTGSMKVTFNNLAGVTRTFDTEMLQLDISGGNLPAGVQLRESPTLVSTGQTKITTVTGGFHIDSFFDVFTELSVNSGANWTPDPSARHIAAVQSTDSGQCNAVVNYPAATATDNCSGVSAVTCVPASGTTFSKGTTTVTCSATDAGALAGNCSFTVTVVDTQLPTLTCPNNISVIGNACSVQTYTTPTPSDNCPGPTASCSPASGTCFAVGTTTVTCTATDSSANTNSCTFTVTVTPCTITCPGNIVDNVAPGTCAHTETYLAPTTTGMCGTVTCAPVSGSSFSKGVTTVTCSTTAGPTCSFTVTINDNEAPVLAGCNNVSAFTASNACSAVVNYTQPTASDVCDGARTVTCNPTAGSTFPKGVTTVSCSASDTSNNTGMCTFTVTVTDNVAPVFSGCTNVSAFTATNSCDAVVNYTQPTATDNCDGARPVVCNPASGQTFQKGVTTVTCTASDLNMPTPNINTCMFTVTVTDNVAPVLSGCTNLSAFTASNSCAAVVTYTQPTATDNCDGARTVTCVPASGSSFNKGVTTVSCSAMDTSTNTGMCTFTVTVTDNVAPVLSGCTNVTANTASNACNAVVSYTQPTANDNCDGARTVTCNPASGQTFAKGVTTVSCSASDTSNNTGNCTFTVTVTDNVAPVLSGCNNVTANTAANSCTAVVSYTQPTANDNCDGARTVTCSPASGSTFSKGVTTVSCSATDTSSNTGTCTFTVTVSDATPPVITCPANVTKGTDPGVCNAVVTYPNATATDNCGVVTPSCVPASGTTFQKGVTTVTCTVSDSSNNSASCTFTVTVNDTQNPTVTCPSNITFTTPGNSDPCGVVTYSTPSGNDNCPLGPNPVTCLPASGTCFPVGMTTVTCTVTDTSGNQGSCTFKITVQNPCTITCPANIVKNNDPNQCGAVVTFAPMTTGGGCGTVACSPASGSFFPKGTTTVNCTTAGPSCSFTVTVNDTQPPNITCPANVTKNTDPNVCQAVVTYPAPTVSDNCPGVGAPTCTPASGSTFPKGTTTVTCVVKDSSMNMSMCSFTVTVVDMQPPVFPNGCPGGITKTAQASCPFTTSTTATYTTPVATDNCPPPPTVVCNPPSGSMFPPGTTTVTCTATDSSGNMATCTFPVNIYSFCLKDDASDQNVVFVNAVSGAYLFCQNGVPIASGTGTLVIHGCNFQIDHTKGDRKVHIQGDTSVNSGTGAGSAYLQKIGGGFVMQITDRKMSDNTCVCAPLPPPAPTPSK